VRESRQREDKPGGKGNIAFLFFHIFHQATAHAAKLFSNVDKDGDGQLNEKEFLEVHSHVSVEDFQFLPNTTYNLFFAGLPTGH
jgi:hypothetical protein